MERLDYLKIINNIYYLAKQKDIKINELERECGMSIGYLSRFKNSNSDTEIGLNKIYAIAKKLDISIDLLINSDLGAASSTETYLIKFINALIYKSNDFKLNWEIYKMDYDFSKSIDIFRLDNNEYISPSCCNDGFTSNPLIYCEFQKDKVVIVAKIKTYSNLYYNLCLFDRNAGTLEELCSSELETNSIYQNGLESLYLVGLKDANSPKISKNAFDIISNFLD